MKDLMIDLETLATRPDAVILQIATAAFDRDSTVLPVEGLNLLCDIEWQRDRHIDHATVAWWGRQECMARVFAGTLDLDYALMRLSTHWHENSFERVWGNGAAFDVAILEHAFHTRDLKVPWGHRQVRDTRTLWDEHGRPEVDFRGTRHWAPDDAVHQARQVQGARAISRDVMDRALQAQGSSGVVAGLKTAEQIACGIAEDDDKIHHYTDGATDVLEAIRDAIETEEKTNEKH